ncbi:MAG TPA: hypothetical protein VFM14_04085 [Gemmatimonadales bacterium]|nr:hypothetical protein [Gemmatimonadales bacterium]
MAGVCLALFTAPLHAQNPRPQVAVAPFSVESDSTGAVRAVAEACLDGLVSELRAKGITVVQHAQLSETKLAAARPALVAVLGKFRREGAQYPGDLRLMEVQSGEELRAYFTNDKDPAAAAKSGQAAAGRIASVLKELKAQPPGRRAAGQDSLTGPMVRMITGDPEKPGRFVVRITFPRGSHTEPHYHTADVTGRVLRGRLLMGSTARFDTTRVVPFEQRGSKVVKAREVHFDWWPEGGELEIEGKGPMETVMVDSTGKPLPR